MIQILNSNLFDSTAEAWVNTVNTVGVSGKGIALEFKKRFPENFHLYKKACDAKVLKPGEIFLVCQNANPKWIVNLATKDHWRNKSRMEWIEKGLYEIRNFVEKQDIKSISMPPIGCGNGGLNWTMVKSMIFDILKETNSNIYLHEYWEIYK